MRSAILLAAGRGERMRPLTDALPKPLLAVGGKALIQCQVERLVRAGFDDIVVNHSYLGALIEQALGDGSRFGARIRYSPEEKALETAGGVAQALRLLGPEPVLVVSADIHTSFDYASLRPRMHAIAAEPDRTVAHFVLVDNRPWHPGGDMALVDGRVRQAEPRLTYGNISVFAPALFRGIEPGTWLKIFPWAYRFVDANLVTGERFTGDWDNVGTPEHLAALDRRIR